jgi:hypothetical protein
MDRVKLLAVTEKYCSKVSELKNTLNTTGVSSFDDIVGNYLGVIQGQTRLFKRGNREWSDIRARYFEELSELKRYLRLCETFPEYGAAESASTKGFFPQIRSRATIEDYISHSEGKLMQSGE